MTRRDVGARMRHKEVLVMWRCEVGVDIRGPEGQGLPAAAAVVP
jgi:hypothetical protein